MNMSSTEIDVGAMLSNSVVPLIAAPAALWVLVHAKRALYGDSKLTTLEAKHDEKNRLLQSALKDEKEARKKAEEKVNELRHSRQRLEEQIRAQQPDNSRLPMRAIKFHNVDFVTFANHKGGVGKSTLLAWVARFAAEEAPGLNVLVVDLSIYGDATRLLLGNASSLGKQKVIEDFVQDSLRVPALGGSVRDYIVPTALSNVFVMVNNAAKAGGVPLQCLDDITNSAASHVSHALRAGLSRDATKDGTKWLVLVDTDGGNCTGYAKLALVAADRVVVPLSANVHDANRLPVFLNFLEKLHRNGMARATLTNLVFNSIQSANNNKTTTLSPFVPTKAVFEAMKRVLRHIETLEAKFPLAFATVRASSIKDIVTSVRRGGKDMCEATSANIFCHSAGNAERDLKAFAAMILAAPTGFGTTQQCLPALT